MTRKRSNSTREDEEINSSSLLPLEHHGDMNTCKRRRTLLYGQDDSTTTQDNVCIHDEQMSIDDVLHDTSLCSCVMTDIDDTSKMPTNDRDSLGTTDVTDISTTINNAVMCATMTLSTTNQEEWSQKHIYSTYFPPRQACFFDLLDACLPKDKCMIFHTDKKNASAAILLQSLRFKNQKSRYDASDHVLRNMAALSTIYERLCQQKEQLSMNEYLVIQEWWHALNVRKSKQLSRSVKNHNRHDNTLAQSLLQQEQEACKSTVKQLQDKMDMLKRRYMDAWRRVWFLDMEPMKPVDQFLTVHVYNHENQRVTHVLNRDIFVYIMHFITGVDTEGRFLKAPYFTVYYEPLAPMNCEQTTTTTTSLSLTTSTTDTVKNATSFAWLLPSEKKNNNPIVRNCVQTVFHLYRNLPLNVRVMENEWILTLIRNVKQHIPQQHLVVDELYHYLEWLEQEASRQPGMIYARLSLGERTKLLHCSKFAKKIQKLSVKTGIRLAFEYRRICRVFNQWILSHVIPRHVMCKSLNDFEICLDHIIDPIIGNVLNLVMLKNLRQMCITYSMSAENEQVRRVARQIMNFYIFCKHQACFMYHNRHDAHDWDALSRAVLMFVPLTAQDAQRILTLNHKKPENFLSLSCSSTEFPFWNALICYKTVWKQLDAFCEHQKQQLATSNTLAIEKQPRDVLVDAVKIFVVSRDAVKNGHCNDHHDVTDMKPLLFYMTRVITQPENGAKNIKFHSQATFYYKALKIRKLVIPFETFLVKMADMAPQIQVLSCTSFLNLEQWPTHFPRLCKMEIYLSNVVPDCNNDPQHQNQQYQQEQQSTAIKDTQCTDGQFMSYLKRVVESRPCFEVVLIHQDRIHVSVQTLLTYPSLYQFVASTKKK